LAALLAAEFCLLLQLAAAASQQLQPSSSRATQPTQIQTHHLMQFKFKQII
jgi:hypothetical protein